MNPESRKRYRLAAIERKDITAAKAEVIAADKPEPQKHEAHAWKGPHNLPVADARKRRREQRQAQRQNRET